MLASASAVRGARVVVRASGRTRVADSRGSFACERFPACSGCESIDAPLAPACERALREYLVEKMHGDGARTYAMFRGRSTRWRCKAKLAARDDGDGGVALGLFARGTHDVVGIDACEVSHEAVDAASALVRATCAAMDVEAYDERTGGGELRYVQVVCVGDGASEADPALDSRARASISLVFNSEGMTKRIESIVSDLAARGGDFVHGIWVNLQNARTNTIFNDAGWRHAWGERLTYLSTPNGTRVYYLPGSFMQANPEAYGSLLERLPRHVPRGARVVEMYAGTGAIGFSLLTNESLEVRSLRCVESSTAVKEAWERTRDELPSVLQSRASLQVEKADRLAVESTMDCDVLIVDPPRKGLGNAVRAALTSDTLSDDLSTLLYVSCGLDSFMRDSDALLESGKWRLKHGESFVFFPATNHIETFAVFTRCS